MLLIGVLDAIDAFPEPFSIVPNEICGLQGLCASGCALRSEICGSQSSSHIRMKATLSPNSLRRTLSEAWFS